MSKTNLLSFLVEETFLLDKNHLSFSDLERKLYDFSISFMRGEFIPQIQMLRFRAPMGTIDVPVNWSCFALDHGCDYVWITTNNDEDNLLKVMKISWDKELKSLLVLPSDGYCYLIGLREADEYYLKDLVNPQEILIKAA